MTIAGDLDLGAPETELHFTDGRIVRVSTALLQQVQGSDCPALPSDDAILIPVVEEQLEVSKRVVETGHVYLNKTIDSYPVTLDETLAVDTWQIERVAKQEVLQEAPPTRQEGQTTVYPIVEERLILTKELLLVEEVRVTRIVSERRDTQTVLLRRERLSVEHQAPHRI